MKFKYKHGKKSILNKASLPLPKFVTKQIGFIWGFFSRSRLRQYTLYACSALILFGLVSIPIEDWIENRVTYTLTSNAERVLLEPEPTYAALFEHDYAEQIINYNSGYNPGGDVVTENSSSKFSAAFHMDPDEGNSITDKVNNVTLSLIPQFPLKDPIQEQNRVLYQLRGKEAVRVISVGAIGYKEDIVLEDFLEDEMSFSYEVVLPEGTEMRLENDGSLSVYGVDPLLLGNVSTGNEDDAALLARARENGEKTNLLFRSPKPYIVEGERRVSQEANAWYTLEDNILTLHASNLGAADYPISIDPSIYVETARKLMRGNNETNIDFDIDNELIQKGFTTGARIDSWTNTMNLNDGRWNGGTAVAGGFIYAVGGEKPANAGSSYSTGGSYSFIVPAGVTEVTIEAWGGGGGGAGSGVAASGDGDGGAGGGGGFARSTISVTPSETLDVYVGGGGAGGSFSTGTAGTNSGDGGGGGGRSYVERSGTPLIIAGGGGGGGGGDNSSTTDGGAGGAGGGTNGGNGSASSSSPGGTGGTDSSGGTGGGGAGNRNDGDDGGSEFGGAGADGGNGTACTSGSANNGGVPNGGDGGYGDDCDSGFAGGGGGGDGYYGGGGGSGSTASNAGAGGGGGGSSYATGSSITLTAGSGTVPGNDGDSDRSGAGDGGGGGQTPSGSGSAGDDGRIVITYVSTGTGPRADVYWAQLSTTNNSIESPNPGAGVCTNWCTDSVYDLPDERVGFSLVAYNGFLYAIGGEDDTGTRQNTVYIAKLGVNGEPSLWHPTDTNKNNWVYWYSSANTLANATSYGAAAAYNNRLYFLGGQTGASTGGVNTVYVAEFDPTGDIEAWSTTGMTVLPSVRHMHSVQTYNDYIYLIGGNSNGTLQDTVYYTKIDDDGTLNVWTQTESFSTARSTWGGNNSLIWGGYIYLAGGCTAVNGSGYCTTVASDTQLASINADGSLDFWSEIVGLTNQRIGYGYLAWDNALYRIGGCETQNTSNGECDLLSSSEDYGVLNPAGEVSTVNISTADGVGDCSGGSPINCDLPPAGESAGQGGQLLPATTVLNGHIYVIGGCGEYDCGNNGSPANVEAVGNISYAVINSDGSLGQPSSCIDSYYGAWCVDSTNTINGTSGTAASGVAVFNNRIYVIGGLTGSGNHGNLYYNTVNDDGSLAGTWSVQTLSSINVNSNIAYTYAYARANPSSAGTYPGNLFIFGGCSSTNEVGCNGTYETEVYKCWIEDSGEIETTADNASFDCTTTGQLQIDITPPATYPGDTDDDGIGIHSGTVYANYIYLIGGYSGCGDGSSSPFKDCEDMDEVMIAQFDDNNNVVSIDAGPDWIEAENKLNVGRRRGYAFGYNGHIYALGGYDADLGGGTVLPFIEWSKIDVSDGSLDTFVTSSVTINQRWGLSVAVSNSFAYVFGGCSVGDSPNLCSEFEPSVQTFQLYNNNSGTAAGYSAGANLFNTDRYGSSAAVIDNYIYVAGGCTSTTDCTDATNSVQYAAIDEEGDIGTWSAATNLPADRAWGQLEAAGGTLYYIGGQDDTATNEQSTVYYGTPNGSGNVTSWSTATNGLPAARTQFSSAVWNDRVYVVGGLDSSASETNTVYISPQLSSGGNITSAWTTETDVPDVARSGHTVIAYANNLYSIGGYDGANYLSDSQFTQINSDGTLDAWTFTTNLPVGLRQADGFASNGYIYLFGGRTADNVCAPNTFITPISANTFISVGNEPTGVGEWYETNQNYTGDRYGAAAALYQGKAYVLGGICSDSSSTSFPSVSSVTTSSQNSDSTTHNASMPATVDSGDLLLMLMTIDDRGGTTITTPTGWTQLTLFDAGQLRLSVFAKDADGTEDSTSVNFSSSAATQSAQHVYRIPASEWHGTVATGVNLSTFDSGNTNTPDPPALNPTNWGTEKTLWIAYAGGRSYGGVTSYPSNYSNGQFTNSGGTGNSDASVSSAERQLETDAENPGVFDHTGTTDEQSGTITLAVRPAAGTNALTGSNRVAQTTLLSQPQVARYSRLIDTDSDVFPTDFLLNGIDNSIGARWEVRYRSSTDATSSWGQETNFGEVSLGTVNAYTPLDGAGSNTDFARFYYFWIEIDSSQAFGYPEDVNRGPTINDLTLFFTSDPSKRLRHGKTFTGGEKQPLDTPPGP